MKVTLTRGQMLAKWRTIRAVEPQRLDCSIHRVDGPDVDAILEAEMRSWYLDMLDHADVRLLVTAQLASEAQTESCSPAGVVIVTPPAGTRRVLSVGFGHEAPVAPDGTVGRVVAAANNPMWGRTAAAMLPDGRVMAAPASGRALTDLTVIADPGPEIYEFDDSIWREMTF